MGRWACSHHACAQVLELMLFLIACVCVLRVCVCVRGSWSEGGGRSRVDGVVFVVCVCAAMVPVLSALILLIFMTCVFAVISVALFRMQDQVNFGVCVTLCLCVCENRCAVSESGL